MPLYEFECNKCGSRIEEIAQMSDAPPVCCSDIMTRIFTGSVAIRDSRSLTGKRYSRWHDRLDDIHKEQADRGERLRMPHPKQFV